MLEERLAAVEAAVSRLTELVESPATRPSASALTGGDFWVLDELVERHPEGALAYAGHVELPVGPVRWQMGADPHRLLDADWDAPARRLAGLAHPVRLRLLQLVLGGRTTTAELARADDLGTTGQLHHHLRQLVAAGWLASAGRGRYVVPATRIVPLLLIVAAAGE